jgi:two-component system chemotaxis response regulator CheB
MPLSVLDHVAVDHVAPADRLGALLARLSGQEVEPGAHPGPSALMRKESEIVDLNVSASPDPPGDPAGLGCPQCGGSLYEIDEKGMVRYRCRVGHAWSPESLLSEQSEALESALWMALRTLEDRAALCRRIEATALDRGAEGTAARFRVQAAEAEDASRVMRRSLERAQRATSSAERDELGTPGPASDVGAR